MNNVIRKIGRGLLRALIVIAALLLTVVSVLWRLTLNLLARLYGALSFLIFGHAPLASARYVSRFVLKDGVVRVTGHMIGYETGDEKFRADLLRAEDLYSDVNELVFGHKLNPSLHLAVVKAAAKQKASELDRFQHVLADLFGSGDAQIVTDVNDLPDDLREALAKMFGGGE